MDLERLERLERLAGVQHGLVTFAQHGGGSGRSSGSTAASRSAWYRALRSGHLVQVHPGVARLRGAPSTREQAIAAAVLAVAGSVASHRSAAYLWGIDRPASDPVDVIVRRARHSRRLAGVIVHRPRDRADLSASGRSGIRVTNPLRMLCDLAAVDPDAVAGAIEHVIIAGYVTPSGLRHLVQRHAVRGRDGVVALRRAVREWPLGDKPADSVLEAKMAVFLQRYRLPPASFHVMVHGYEVDFLIDDSTIVLECDGWDAHGRQRDQFEFDRVRDAVLLGFGYTTVRFTWDRITRRQADTARRIEDIVARWAPDLVARHRSRA